MNDTPLGLGQRFSLGLMPSLDKDGFSGFSGSRFTFGCICIFFFLDFFGVFGIIGVVGLWCSLSEQIALRLSGFGVGALASSANLLTFCFFYPT